MKRLSHAEIRKARRMIANGARLSDAAKILGVSRQALSGILFWNGQSGVEVEPAPSELIHVDGESGYPGFDLLPADARRIHEVRNEIGWYSFHADYDPVPAWQ